MRSKHSPLIYPKMYINLLRDSFHQNANPSAEDRKELANMTEMSFEQINSWFYRERKLQQVTTKNSSTSSRNIPLAQRRREGRPQYLRDIDARSKKRVTMDIGNVKKKGIVHFPTILEAWNLKAKRLHILATKSRFHKEKKILQREAKKVKEIVQGLDILSAEQKQEVDRWEQIFRTEMTTSRKTAPQVEEDITNLILPWVTPYIYSKVTTQFRRYLVLESGIKDLANFVNIHTTVDWQVPTLVNSQAHFSGRPIQQGTGKNYKTK